MPQSNNVDVSLKSSQSCDFNSASFIRDLIDSFQSGRDVTLRDDIAKALCLNRTIVNDDATFEHPNNLGADAIIDLYVEVLQFCASLSFSPLQTQQVILLYCDTVDLILIDESPSREDSQLQMNSLSNVLFNFTRKLAKLCSRRETLVDERTTVLETREEETTDPQALAAYEAKIARKKGPDKNLEPPPKIKVKITEEKDVFTRKTVSIGPYFSASEMRQIVEFFDVTLFQHWRLVRFVMTTPRPTKTMNRLLFIEDVPSFLPPLCEAMTQQSFIMAEQRSAVESEYHAIRSATEDDESSDRQRLENAWLEETRYIIDKEHQEREADLSAALPESQYREMLSALTRAAISAAGKNIAAAGLLRRVERVESTGLTMLNVHKLEGTVSSSLTASPNSVSASSSTRKK